MASWQLVQVTCKATVCLAKVCGKRQVGKGAHAIYSGCSCSRRAYTSVLFITVEVQVNTRSSLYTPTVRVRLLHAIKAKEKQWCYFQF